MRTPVSSRLEVVMSLVGLSLKTKQCWRSLGNGARQAKGVGASLPCGPAVAVTNKVGYQMPPIPCLDASMVPTYLGW